MTRAGVAGRIAGIPVEIGWSWLVVLPIVGVALFASTPDTASDPARIGAAASGAFMLLASVVLHELGHVVVARRRGIEVERVAVLLLGGYSEMDLESAGPAAERSVALAGPMVSAGAAAILWVSASIVGTGPLSGDPAARVLTVLALVNLGVAVLNILPVFPLDGGRVVRAALVARGVSRPVAERRAIRVGLAVGMLLTAGGVVASALGSTAALVLAPVGVTLVVVAASAREQAETLIQEI